MRMVTQWILATTRLIIEVFLPTTQPLSDIKAIIHPVRKSDILVHLPLGQLSVFTLITLFQTNLCHLQSVICLKKCLPREKKS